MHLRTMKNYLALLLGGALCLGGIAPSTSEAATVVISTGHHVGRGRVWVRGHNIWRHHHRVWIPGHYIYR